MLSYVVIDQRYDKDTRLTVDYTLTNGEFANDIYAGEALNDCANPDIDKVRCSLSLPFMEESRPHP